MRNSRLMMSVGMAVLVAGAAFGADHPGQKFQISPASLPKPYATPAAGNQAEDISRPAGTMPDVPRGFAVSVFADHLANARWMAVAPNGDVFLAEPTREAGKITLLRDTNGDGKADKTFTFASSGFQYPHGLAFHEGYLYVGDLQAIWRIPYKDGQTVAGKPERVTTKVADLRPKGGHVTRDIAFGPDGALYLAMGSRDNISDFKPGAQVFKVNADGSMAEFASGIRNPVGIAFAPGTGTLYVTTNERAGRRSAARLPDQREARRLLWLPLRLYRQESRSGVGCKRPRKSGGDHHPGRAVPRPFRAHRAGFLYRRHVPGRIQGRCLRVPARFVECGGPHRLQGGAGAFFRRQAGKWL
jgi:glucose/arabinose dehydrogenase